LLLAVRGVQVTTGIHSSTAALTADTSNIEQLGKALFTDYVFAFELTSALLVIAVVGAVVLARRAPREVHPE
jgi:NADH-quinone oxidoreductase subunit J